MRVAFVTTWYGRDIGGGAEAECRGLVHAIRRHRPEISIEVLTTCLKEFASDWNVNHYDPGVYLDEGVTVRRFFAEPHERCEFHPLNYYRLMPPVLNDLLLKEKVASPLTSEEERAYISNMVVSPDLLQYIEASRDRFDCFVFIPYMFATSVLGSQRAKGKYAVIPCLHQERYAFMEIYRKMLNDAAGVFFHVPAEQRFANLIYSIPKDRQFMVGERVDTKPPVGDSARFRAKFNIDEPYFLYSGRKIEGKNLPELVRLFESIRGQFTSTKPQLVIIGAGDLNYTAKSHDGIHDLGFVSAADKFDAMAGAQALIQPSLNESFSIVMMEAWLQGTPVIADTRCDVTREHCEISNGGLSYRGADELLSCMLRLLDNDTRSKLGISGRRYVRENFSEDIVVSRVVDALTKISAGP